MQSRSARLLYPIAFLIALVGCSAPKPAGPTAAPAIPDGVALRPEFAYGANKTQRTGTAFVVQAKSGTKYLVTAAHLYRAKEWPTMRTITLHSFEGTIVDVVREPPLYVGRYTEDSSERDYAEDLVVTPLPEGATAAVLKLAKHNAQPGEHVWALGCEVRKPAKQRAYACYVVKHSETEIHFSPYLEFNPWDFSGGPVVNAQGEVVGNLLAGRPTQLIGTTAAVMRKRFAALNVELEE